MLPGTTAIDIPVIPDTLELKAFNELFAHLFCTLSGKQAMPAWKVSPSSGTTIAALLDRTFPAIPSIDNIDFKLPTPLITPKTVGYIHALIIDSVTSLHSESAYARALTREATVVKELEALSVANFRLQFRLALISYYEGHNDSEAPKSRRYQSPDYGPHETQHQQSGGCINMQNMQNVFVQNFISIINCSITWHHFFVFVQNFNSGNELCRHRCCKSEYKSTSRIEPLTKHLQIQKYSQ